MPAVEEISVVYLHERFRFENPNGEVIVGAASTRNEEGDLDEVAIKGAVDEELEEGESYRLWGRWRTYTNPRTRRSEEQFNFQTFVPCEPLGRRGIMLYLGESPQIGPVLASRLWSKYRHNAVVRLRTDPEGCAAEIHGLGSEAATAAAEHLRGNVAKEHTMIEIVDLLGKRGFPRKTAKRAIEQWGNRAAWKIRRSPYSLMMFRGCGFKLCDALYLELGGDPRRMKRQVLCAWYATESERGGDTWLYVGQVEQAVRGSIGGTDANPNKAIAIGCRAKILKANRTNGKNGEASWDGDIRWIAEGRRARAEQTVAKILRKSLEGYPEWL